MGPFAFKYPDVAPMGAATGRWGAREQGLECASEGMATGLRSRKCCLRSLQGGRGGGGGWQPGGQLSCEQMTSAAAIALGRTTQLPRVKASGVGATKCQGPTDASGVSMQGPDGVVGLSSKLRSRVMWPRIRAWKRCAWTGTVPSAKAQHSAACQSSWLGQADDFSLPSRTRLSAPPPCGRLPVPGAPLRALGCSQERRQGLRGGVRAGAAQSSHLRFLRGADGT